MRRITEKILNYFQPKPKIVTSVLKNNLTYLSAEALNDLYKQVRQIEQEKMEGILIEAGCALGGSAIIIASAKNRSRPFFIYDVFGMIPPPSEKDGPDVKKRYQIITSGKSKGIDGNKYYGYEDDLYNKVISNFKKYDILIEEKNIQIIKGLFENVLHCNQPVALAHLDGDWYDSVMICLERITPYLITNGTLIIDDYYCWSGCKRAVDDFFRNRRNEFMFKKKARLHVIKK